MPAMSWRNPGRSGQGTGARGPQFASTWNGAPLAALVARIPTMPPEKPAGLLQEQRVDILAYILWYNGLPLGNEPLPVEQDVLSNITFQAPTEP